MRRRMILLCTCSSLLLGLVGGGRAEEKPEAILDKAIQAHGGAERLAGVKAEKTKSEGNGPLPFTIKVGGSKVEKADFTREASYAFPDRFKEDLSMDIPPGITSESATVFNRGKGLTRVSISIPGQKGAGNNSNSAGVGLANLKEQVHRKQVRRLVCLKEKAYTLSPLGDEKVADKPAVGVRVQAKGFRDVDLFFDKQTGLLVQMRYQEPTGEGKKLAVEEIVTEHQQVDGLVVPKKIVVKWNGKQIQEEHFLEVQLLKTALAEKVFAIPSEARR